MCGSKFCSDLVTCAQKEAKVQQVIVLFLLTESLFDIYDELYALTKLTNQFKIRKIINLQQ